MTSLRITVGGLVAFSLAGCTSYRAAAEPEGRTVASRPTAAILQGTEWALERMGGVQVLEVEGARPTLVFYEPGRIAGSASCNRYTGPAEITPDGSLKLESPAALAITRMMCGPDAMAQEQRFLTALGRSGAMSLAGDQLTIQTAKPGESLIFVRSK